mgnify:CR=1 FL=1
MNNQIETGMTAKEMKRIGEDVAKGFADAIADAEKNRKNLKRVENFLHEKISGKTKGNSK